VKDLLVLLGKRVHDLRVAKEWSQEEFAHVSGLHRTYIGQIERGEKNISFGNLVRVSNALGVTMAELLAELETGGPEGPKRPPDSSDLKGISSSRRMLDLQKLLTRLRVQRAAMDRTMALLEELMLVTSTGGRSNQRRSLKK
jgi:transcriptional regulator with XRE-family HTH domain